jgi:predicted aspartyl protease
MVSDALVDTGATLLSLPSRLIRQLGLNEQYRRRVTSSVGIAEAGVYDAVRLTIQGRSCTMDVMEVPDDVPVLIGQLPLEHLDFVIDPRSRTLVGNPAHGGEHMFLRQRLTTSCLFATADSLMSPSTVCNAEEASP